jgi:putative tryptophan/tyrosine transport system substrate-binding protein
MQFDRLKRRDFITLLGGAAAWPLAARAQQAGGMRRVGVLMNLTADDPEASARVTAFAQGLQQLGWTVGHNMRIDYRWGATDTDRSSKAAAELVALAPDVVLASGTPAVVALKQATPNVPMVFVNIVDPVSAGFVDSLAQPGGNATGFISFEYVISAKWLELLKDIAPQLKRVAVLREPDVAAGIGQLAVIQAAAPSFGVEVRPVSVRDADQIERAVTAFARSSDGGLIVTASSLAAVHRKLIIALAARLRLPAVYGLRYHATSGGLISYGPDTIAPFRRAAGYVDRILKGEKPADLPVQAPTKYELVINLKTAKALGLTVPDTVLARADEVIE